MRKITFSKNKTPNRRQGTGQKLGRGHVEARYVCNLITTFMSIISLLHRHLKGDATSIFPSVHLVPGYLTEASQIPHVKNQLRKFHQHPLEQAFEMWGLITLDSE